MENSFEPMDVDLSGNSITYMEVSFNEPPLEYIPDLDKVETQPTSEINSTLKTQTSANQAAGVKIYHIVKKSDKKPTFTPSHIAVSLIAVAFASILAYQLFNVNCGGEVDPYHLSEKLHRKVYGQYMALTDIINAFKNVSKTKILFFYGGTGVGKTYTVSLMLENRWNFTNVYHYTMPSFVTTFTTELMLGLTLCNTALFVVDDLIPSDVRSIKTHIQDIVQKNEEIKKNIIIILVFNCDNSDKDFMRKCNDSFYKELEESFSNINAFKQYVKFEQLSEQHLKKCVEDELGEGQIDEVKFRKLLKNFNVSLDGCKGVHKKIKFLNNL